MANKRGGAGPGRRFGMIGAWKPGKAPAKAPPTDSGTCTTKGCGCANAKRN